MFLRFLHLMTELSLYYNCWYGTMVWFISKKHLPLHSQIVHSPDFFTRNGFQRTEMEINCKGK